MTVLMAVSLFALAAVLAARAAPMMAPEGADGRHPDGATEKSAMTGLVLAALAAVTAMTGAATLSSGEASPAGFAPFVLSVLVVGLPIAARSSRRRHARGDV